MPVLTGFEMLAALEYMPQVVFATAYDSYAIRAFEENSVDYLLKPIEAERLEITMQKLRKQKQEMPNMAQEIAQLLAKIQPAKERPMTSISTKVGDRILLIRLSEISHFEAEDKYVYLYTLEGKKHLLDYSLTTLEEKLPATFLRVSRSAILNSEEVKEMQKYFNGKFIFAMQDAGKSKITSGGSFADKIKKHFDI
jgi:two-component system LytT family response regulator